MFIAMLTATVLSYCPFPYGQHQSATIKFEAGSAEISSNATNTIQSLLYRGVGNIAAELHIRAFFPYGAPEGGDVRYTLAFERVDKAKATAAALGFSLKQIETRVSAIGFVMDSNYNTRIVPYDAAELDRVEVLYRERTSCFPLEMPGKNDEQYSKPPQ